MNKIEQTRVAMDELQAMIIAWGERHGLEYLTVSALMCLSAQFHSRSRQTSLPDAFERIALQMHKTARDLSHEL